MQWQTSIIVWDRLAAVAIGPLLQRRAMRQIDFAPTRPELIERAIVSLGQAKAKAVVDADATADSTAKAMERIGTPAKGFPALEWLLWTRPVQPGSSACHYAHQLASDIRDEARALAQAFAALAALDASANEEAASPAMAELLNQWVGALERLRWAQMEKPLRSTGQSARRAATSAAPAPSASAFPRSASGSTAPGWVAQWEAIRVMGVASRAPMSESVPAPGQGLVSLETYLRGRGLNPLANKLAASVGQVQQALPDATPANSAKVLAATRPLGQLKRLVEAEVAPALEVNIGFSDADGD
jgi:predicted lipoprotein